ncbi:MAG TPA: glucose-6-phosphate dehydrogenase assembly protein OpcA, partial [Terriglobales bacterium]|nr:glucose-6-phosphate dehydrogenase assembly protein OpcA [Terriglobales bacterium]
MAASGELCWHDGHIAALEAQWRALRETSEEAPAHALALNLICRVADAADAERMAQHLWKLGRRHPARVFLVHAAEEGGPDRVRLAACADGSELVELQLEPRRAASVVMPHLAGDLPVVLLWRGSDPRGDAEFRLWSGLANRVLLDAQRLRLSSAQVAALAHELPAGATLGELTWSRLTPWRLLLCQGLEGELAAPEGIREVSIAAGGLGAGGSLAATLFTGWLAEKLGWRPLVVSTEGLLCSRPAGEPVRIRFAPANQHECLLRQVVVRGATTAVIIEHHGPHVSMTVTRDGATMGQWIGSSPGETILRSDNDTL